MTKKRKRSAKKRILVVDDDEIIVTLIKEILEEEGFKVDIAGDGMEGLERIKKNGYDAIISNMNMPRMKGDKLYLEVKELSPALAKKILFISGNISDFIKSTGNRYLKKPFSREELVKTVKDIIGSYKKS
jgi:DNA-binding response OmpR family regulator